MPLPLPLVGQKGDEWIQMKALPAIGWGVCGFCEVKRAIFRILRPFWGMMSLRKKYVFLASLNVHSGSPPSPITRIPLFLSFATQKWGGGPWSPPNPGPWVRGGGVLSPHAKYMA